MGNQLIKNYNIDEKPLTYGGHGKLWKIHNASKIGKIKEAVSIFIFDKRTLDKISVKGQSKEEVVRLMRQEATNLGMLKSNQMLLQLEPLIEDPKRIVFSTERVQCSLAQLIQSGEIGKHIQSELDIKVHMLELIEGLSFLHSDAKMVHLGVSPENIYVTASGKWKLSGPIFGIQTLNELPFEVAIDFSPKPYDSSLKMYPNLAYTAPELTSTPSKCSYKSDIYSLGMILINLLKYRHEKNLTDFNVFEVDTIYAHRNNFKNLVTILEQCAFFKSSPQVYNCQNLQSLQSLLLSLVKEQPQQRPSLMQFHQSEFIMDPLVQTINHLQRLEQMDSQQQQLFMGNLAKQFLKFEILVVKCTILPKVLPMVVNENLMVQIVQIVIEITKKHDFMTKVEYNNLIWQNLKNISTVKSVPAKCLFLMVQHLSDFYHYVSNEEVQVVLIPLYLKCLECNVFKLQEVALKATDIVVSRLDYVYTKNKILPRLLQMCLDPNIQSRTTSIATLKKIHSIFDRTSITEHILPTIDKMRKLGYMNRDLVDVIYHMYSGFCEGMNNEQLVAKGIPMLLPYMLENDISKAQLLQFSSLVKTLVQRVEDDRLKVQIVLNHKQILKDDIKPQPQAQQPQPVPSVDENDFSKQKDEGINFNLNFENVKFENPFEKTHGPESEPEQKQVQVQDMDPYDFGSFAKPFATTTVPKPSTNNKTPAISAAQISQQFDLQFQMGNNPPSAKKYDNFAEVVINHPPPVQYRASENLLSESYEAPQQNFQPSTQPNQLQHQPQSQMQPTSQMQAQSFLKPSTQQQPQSQMQTHLQSQVQGPPQPQIQMQQQFQLQPQSSISQTSQMQPEQPSFLPTFVQQQPYQQQTTFPEQQWQPQQSIKAKYDDLFNMDPLVPDQNQATLLEQPKPAIPNPAQLFQNFGFSNDYAPLQNDKSAVFDFNFEEPVPKSNDGWGF